MNEPTGRKDLEGLSPRDRAEHYCRHFHLPLTEKNLRAFTFPTDMPRTPDPEGGDPDYLDELFVPSALRKRRIFVFPGGS